MMPYQLEQHDFDVWFAPTKLAIDEPAFVNLLSTDERQRYRGFLFDEHRREYLIAHALLRLTLSRYSAVAPRDWEFQCDEHGKPRIVPGMIDPPLYFSLSHTRGMVACAVARVDTIGLDVENPNRRSTWSDISNHFFAAAEVEYLSSLPPEHRRPAFFEIWTMKEAFLKAIGSGLFTALDSFAIYPGGDGQAIQELGKLGGEKTCWCFTVNHPSAAHVLSTAIGLPEGQVARTSLRDASDFLIETPSK